jgi:hypothetical protein
VINATAHHASFAVRRAAVPLIVKDGGAVVQLPDSDHERSIRIRFARYNCHGMTVTDTVLVSYSPGSATGIHDHGVAARRLLWYQGVQYAHIISTAASLPKTSSSKWREQHQTQPA